MHLLKPTALLLATLVTAGCGGGGGDEPIGLRSAQQLDANSQPDAIQLSPGQATAIEGTVSSTRYVLKSASWQVTDTYPYPAPALSLINADCAVALRSDWNDPVLPDGDHGHSTWVCKVGVTAPSVTSETLYMLTLTGLDAGGNQLNLQKQVRVIP